MSDILGDPGPVDEISQDRGFSRPGRARHGGSTTPGAKLTALTTALAVVLTGGVVTAAWRSFQSHDGPERLVPSTAFAIATVDLGMRGQSDALATFANHFPSSPTHHGDGSAVDRLLRAVFRGTSDPHADYDRDIKPWLGDRLAIAGWMDKAGKPQVEGLVASTDDAAARRLLEKVTKSGGGAFSFADGYAVIGSNPAAVHEAIAAAHKSSLADRAEYADDIDALPGDPALTGWLDGPATRNAIAAAIGPAGAKMLNEMGSMGPLGLFGPMGLVGAAGAGSPATAGAATAALGTTSRTFSGRTTLGVRVDDRYLEIDTRATSANVQHQSSTDTLRALPSSTIATIEMGDPSSLVTGVTTMLKSFGFASSGISCVASVGTGPIPPANAVPMNIPHRKQILREFARERRQLRQQRLAQHNSAGRCTPEELPAPNPLKQLEKATGLQLPADATTVLGDSLLASYGGLSLTGVPKVALRTHPADLSAARSVLDKVQTRLGVTSTFPLAVQTSGDDLVLATSPGYADEVEQQGSLGEEPRVQLAFGTLPDAVAVAGYVDLSKILPLINSVPRDLQALKAIGFWTTLDGSVARSQMRIVVG